MHCPGWSGKRSAIDAQHGAGRWGAARTIVVSLGRRGIRAAGPLQALQRGLRSEGSPNGVRTDAPGRTRGASFLSAPSRTTLFGSGDMFLILIRTGIWLSSSWFCAQGAMLTYGLVFTLPYAGCLISMIGRHLCHDATVLSFHDLRPTRSNSDRCPSKEASEIATCKTTIIRR